MKLQDLPANPSKADELALWKEFISKLPPCSYLALYFAESEDILKQAMADDWSCEPVSAIRKSQQQALMDLDDIMARKKKAAAELEAIKRDVSQNAYKLESLKKDLREVKEAASLLSRLASEQYGKVVSDSIDADKRRAS